MEIIGLTNQIPQSSNSGQEINIDDVKDWVNEQGFLKEHQDISHLITEEKFKQESNKTFKVIDITNWFQKGIFDSPTLEGAIEGAITEEQFNTLLEYDGIIIYGQFIIKNYISITDDEQVFYKEDSKEQITIVFSKSLLLYFVDVQYYCTPTMYHYNFWIEKLSSEFLTANGVLDPSQINTMAMSELITVAVDSFGTFQFYKMDRSYPHIEFVGLFKANDWIKFYCLSLNTDTHTWNFSPIDIQIDITNQLTQLVTLEQRIATLENIVAQLTSTTTNE